MKKSFRIAVEGLYLEALRAVKVRVTKVTAHKDASATISINEKSAAAVKALPGVEVLAESSTSITFRLPAALEYAAANPPNKTAAELEAEAQAKADRRAAREAKRAAAELDFDEEGDDDDSSSDAE